MSTRHLLIVYHTQSGNTGRLAEAAWRGATDDEVTDVEVRMVRASDAGPDDLLWADALLLGTPENSGYMSGGNEGLPRRHFLSRGGQDPGAALRHLHQRRQRR